MGCVNGKSSKGNVFRVSKSKFGKGKLEINSKEMIFYRKGCEKNDAMKILFSLKHLRRYGVDLETNVFCFEAGRSCVTGEGIYALKSHQANDMYEALKSYIEGIDSSTTNEDVNASFMNNLQETQDHLDETLISLRSQRALDQNGIYTAEPRSATNSQNRRTKTFQIRMNSENGMSPPLLTEAPPKATFSYENQFIENNNIIEAVPSSSYVNVTAPITAPISSKSANKFFEEATAPRNYENTDVQNIAAAKRITYTVLELQDDDCQRVRNVKHPPPSTKPYILAKSFSVGNESSPHGAPLLSPADGSNLEPFSYADIDFQKTNALATTVNSNGSTGTRKTRHHSEDNSLFKKSRSILLGI